MLPHHLYDIFLVIIHPSQFTYRQKSEQAHFPASRLFTREAGNVRREVVWDIFEQNTSHHFSVHAGGGKWEVGSGKREALWSPSLTHNTEARQLFFFSHSCLFGALIKSSFASHQRNFSLTRSLKYLKAQLSPSLPGLVNEKKINYIKFFIS